MSAYHKVAAVLPVDVCLHANVLHHDRFTSDSRRVAASPKSAESGQKRLYGALFILVVSFNHHVQIGVLGSSPRSLRRALALGADRRECREILRICAASNSQKSCAKRGSARRLSHAITRGIKVNSLAI